MGTREVVNRPAAGVTTRRPEEPYVNSTRTVPWEAPGATRAPTRREAPHEKELVPTGREAAGREAPARKS